MDCYDHFSGHLVPSESKMKGIATGGAILGTDPSPPARRAVITSTNFGSGRAFLSSSTYQCFHSCEDRHLYWIALLHQKSLFQKHLAAKLETYRSNTSSLKDFKEE